MTGNSDAEDASWADLVGLRRADPSPAGEPQVHVGSFGYGQDPVQSGPWGASTPDHRPPPADGGWSGQASTPTPHQGWPSQAPEPSAPAYPGRRPDPDPVSGTPWGSPTTAAQQVPGRGEPYRPPASSATPAGRPWWSRSEADGGAGDPWLAAAPSAPPAPPTAPPPPPTPPAGRTPVGQPLVGTIVPPLGQPDRPGPRGRSQDPGSGYADPGPWGDLGSGTGGGTDTSRTGRRSRRDAEEGHRPDRYPDTEGRRYPDTEGRRYPDTEGRRPVDRTGDWSASPRSGRTSAPVESDSPWSAPAARTSAPQPAHPFPDVRPETTGTWSGTSATHLPPTAGPAPAREHSFPTFGGSAAPPARPAPATGPGTDHRDLRFPLTGSTPAATAAVPPTVTTSDPALRARHGRTNTTGTLPALPTGAVPRVDRAMAEGSAPGVAVDSLAGLLGTPGAVAPAGAPAAPGAWGVPGADVVPAPPARRLFSRRGRGRSASARRDRSEVIDLRTDPPRVDPPAPGLPGIDFPESTSLADPPDDLSAVIDLPAAPTLRSTPGRTPSGEVPVMPLEWPRVDSGRPISDALPVLGAPVTTGLDEPELRRPSGPRSPSPDEAFPFTEQDLAPDDGEPLPEPESAPTGNRAGRNLPAAIAVGVLLGAAVAVSLYTRPEAFVGVAAVAVILGIWEVSGALSAGRISVPFIPLAVGSLGMLVSAFVAAEEGLLVSFTLTALGIMLWRVIDGLAGAVKDVVAGIFTAGYVPLLAGFAILMLASPRGRLLVLVFVLVTIASDIGGYLAGVLFGVHPMAPTVSPKKSWEGFAGSAAACLAVGIVGVGQLLDGPWWVGAVLGAATVVAATLGDLSESMLKRDLGIKDMGTTLPGHGGVMDRLDSLLLSAPVAYLILTQVLPAVQGMTSLGLP